MLRIRLHLFLFTVMILVAGCTHQGRITPPPNLLAHQTALQTIAHWELNGKLGIRTAEESGSATLKWIQTQQEYRIQLSGPFGQKSMLITGTPSKVILEEAGKKPLTANTAEALIKKAVGWTLPVTQLAFWVRGVPSPREKITRLRTNELGLIDELEQGGWVIQYSSYRQWDIQGKQLTLPQKVIAQYRDVRLILAVRNWQMGADQ